MSARHDATSWRLLREFRDVALESSYVLAWKMQGTTLSIDLDVELEAAHAFFEPPRPAEKACIRPAVLEFTDCELVARADDDRAADPEALVASLGLGRIDDLSVYDDGVYELSGKFGTVIIDAGRPVLRFVGR
jgi:hypothetical protein